MQNVFAALLLLTFRNDPFADAPGRQEEDHNAQESQSNVKGRTELNVGRRGEGDGRYGTGRDIGGGVDHVGLSVAKHGLVAFGSDGGAIDGDDLGAQSSGALGGLVDGAINVGIVVGASGGKALDRQVETGKLDVEALLFEYTGASFGVLGVAGDKGCVLTEGSNDGIASDGRIAIALDGKAAESEGFKSDAILKLLEFPAASVGEFDFDLVDGSVALHGGGALTSLAESALGIYRL